MRFHPFGLAKGTKKIRWSGLRSDGITFRIRPHRARPGGPWIAGSSPAMTENGVIHARSYDALNLLHIFPGGLLLKHCKVIFSHFVELNHRAGQ